MTGVLVYGGLVVCVWWLGFSFEIVCCAVVCGFFLDLVSYLGSCARYMWCVDVSCALVIGKCGHA